MTTSNFVESVRLDWNSHRKTQRGKSLKTNLVDFVSFFHVFRSSLSQVNKGLTQDDNGLTQNNKGLTQDDKGLTQDNKGLTQDNKVIPSLFVPDQGKQVRSDNNASALVIVTSLEHFQRLGR